MSLCQQTIWRHAAGQVHELVVLNAEITRQEKARRKAFTDIEWDRRYYLGRALEARVDAIRRSIAVQCAPWFEVGGER